MGRFLPLGLILSALCANLVTAAPSPASALADAISQARALVKTDIAPKVPGFSVAVAVDGAIVWSEGFGYADLASQKPVTPATRFRIGSVSKPLTAVGLALLVEQGRIDFDAPVQRYLPDFPDKGAVITTRMLAGHLSGIRNYRGRELLSNRPYPDLKSGLKIFEDDPLETAPGTKYSYSSYNWNVIGAEMERATNRDFPGYMEASVFKPLGMINTRADRAGALDPARAQFYEVDVTGRFIVAPPVDSSYKWSSGGFLSTAEDLVRCGSALLQPGFLKQPSLELLFASQRTTTGKLTHYGVGWSVGRSILYHAGESIGGTSVLLLRPSSRTVVAMACNRGHFTFAEVLGRPILKKAADQYSAAVLVKGAEQIARIFAPVMAGKTP